MENTTPFVCVLASYGRSDLFGLVRNAVEERKRPYVILESMGSAVAFDQTFRRMYPDIKTKVVGDSSKPNITSKSVAFTSQKILAEILQSHFSPFRSIDFTKHIFYVIPNRVPYDLTTYLNLRMIEESYFMSYNMQNTKSEDHNVPYVTMYAVNTKTIPKLESRFVIFDKHTDLVPIDMRITGKDYLSYNLYEEMAKLTLDIHTDSPGKTIVAIVPSKAEAETFKGYFDLIITSKLFVRNVWNGGEWTIPEDRRDFTNVYVASDEVLNLVMVSVDIVIDSFKSIVTGKSLSGETMTFSKDSTRDVSMNRCTILQNKLDLSTSGSCHIMTTKSIYNNTSETPQSLINPLLRIGQTILTPLDIFPDTSTVRNDVTYLQSIGALDPDNRTTELGNFVLGAPLSPMEAVVLWTYLQEHWTRGKLCIPALLSTAMISLFSEDDSYYVYPPFKKDIIINQQNHRTNAWTKISGIDDLQTFLELWKAAFSDLGTFDPSYEDMIKWGRDNSLNGDKLYNVLLKTRELEKYIGDCGFVCNHVQSLNPSEDSKLLRRVYSKVYLINRMKSAGKDGLMYRCIADQQLYDIYSPTSINTIQVTDPPEIVAPITTDNFIYVAILFRQ